MVGGAHLEDGNPGIADVVEVDGVLEGVALPGGAVGVVVIPVDAGGVVGAVVGAVVKLALQPVLVQLGQGVAVPHAVLPRLGADEGVLIIILCVIVVARP